MKLTVREITTRVLEVQTLKELVELLKIDAVSYFKVDWGDWFDIVIFFEKLKCNKNPIGRVSVDLIISWIPVMLSDVNAEIKPDNIECPDLKEIYQAAVSLYEYNNNNILPKDISFRIFRHSDIGEISLENIEEMIHQNYLQEMVAQYDDGSECGEEWNDFDYHDDDDDYKPDWLGGMETEKEFWEHTD